MEMSIRKDAVAGQFYPANKEEIVKMFNHYNEIIDESIKDKNILDLQPRAIIVPHAGYVYSAFTANIAFRLLKNSHAKRVVVIGPSHRVYLNGTSVAEYDSYETPLGNLPIDRKLADELIKKFGLYFQADAHSEHSTEVQMPFVKNYLPEASVVELVYGNEDPKNLAKIIEYLLNDEDTVVVISTDLSHYYDINKAKQLDTICLEAVSTLHPQELHQGCEACGKIGVEAMLLSTEKRELKSILLDYRTSADASGDKSQVVGYMSAAFIKEQKIENVKKTLLTLARSAIAEAVGLESKLDLKALLDKNPWLQEQGAAFVTLTRNGGELRGCIGSIIAHQKLYEDILQNAKSAAMSDPRFPSLTQKEFDEITVEVSILSEPKPLEYSSIEDLKSKIRVGIDGVVLKHSVYQATFLPQVWEQLPSFEHFFSHLCQKAGMEADCLSKMPEILTYQVKEYKED